MKNGFIALSAVIRITLLFFLFLPSVALAQEPIILGIHPYLAATEIHKRFTPLAEHLAKKLDRQVNIHIESSYDSHVNTVGTGKVDIAFMGPAPYIILVDKFGKRPLLAAFATKAGKSFRGVIVVRKESPTTTLSQLRGKTFAFGPPPSTMSYLVPRFMLLEAGIDLPQLGTTKFLNNHENIALSVLAGNFEAGAMKEDIFKQYEKEGLRTIAVSDPMPDHLFVARANLPDDLVRTITTTMLTLQDSEDGRQILAAMQNNLVALVPAQDSDYDPLRKVLATLERAGVKP